MVLIDGLQYCKWDRSVFEDLRAGGVSAVHATVAYWESARETLSRLAQWQRHLERNGDILVQVTDAHGIRAAHASGRVGVFFGFQNCSPIEDELGLVEVFRRLGVLVMQLTYNNQSPLAAGCYEAEDSGITRFGREVIREMNRVGMIIDMSHSAERSTLQAMELSERPIVISHANPASFHRSIRNKSDTVLKELAHTGGLLGFSLYPFHLRGGSECTLDEFCDMAARAAEMMGIDCIGIGSDLCLNQPLDVLQWMRSGRWAKEVDFGEGSAANASWPEQPAWFRSSRDFPTILGALERRGFSKADVAKIAGENWLRILERSASGSLQTLESKKEAVK